VISGSLVIANVLFDPDGPDGTFDEVALPKLELVRDRLKISGDKYLVRLALPQLAVVGGAVEIVDNSSLPGVALPRLVQVGGALDISRNPELQDLEGLVELHSVGGDVRVTDDTALTSARLRFGTVGNVDVSDNPSLVLLDVSVSGQLNQVRVANNAITSVRVSGATLDPSRPGMLASVQILDNPRLATVSVFADHIGALSVARNASLDSVFVTADQVGGVTLTENPRVGQLALDGTGTNRPITILGSLTVSGPISTLFSFAGVTVGGDLTLEGTQLVHLVPNNPFVRDRVDQ